MNKKAIKYLHKQGTSQERELWLDPSSKAYELLKEKKMDELNKHIDLCIMAEGKWRKG